MCPSLSFTELKASGVAKSHFLVDSAEIVALHSKNPDDDRLRAKHRYFIDLLSQAAAAMPELRGVASLISDERNLEAIRAAMARLKVRPTDKVTFRVGDHYPAEAHYWHGWWGRFRAQLSPDTQPTRSKSRVRSLLSGELVEPSRVHPKISKLSDVGGLATGDSLASFKQESFRSYGLEQSLNAPVSEEEAACYAGALNTLIAEHGRRLAGAKIVHWFRDRIPVGDDPLPWLESGDTSDELVAQRWASALIDSIRSGSRPELSRNRYYSLTLSGASGRVMVRDWMEGAFEDLVLCVKAWFDDLSIIRRDGAALASAPKFLAVLGSTVRDLDDLESPFVAKMWRVAVRQEPIPRSAMARALARVRVDIIDDRVPNHARMGLLKAFHIRNTLSQEGESHMKPELNENHPGPAYHCGRLMAVLAELQRSALGDIGAGVVQRYYAAASSTPALVLGRLTTTSQHHLAKLEGGLPHWYEDQIAAIWGAIKDSVPSTLSLEQQSLFALGYYQQMAAMRKPKPTNDATIKE